MPSATGLSSSSEPIMLGSSVGAAAGGLRDGAGGRSGRRHDRHDRCGRRGGDRRCRCTGIAATEAGTAGAGAAAGVGVGAGVGAGAGAGGGGALRGRRGWRRRGWRRCRGHHDRRRHGLRRSSGRGRRRRRRRLAVRAGGGAREFLQLVDVLGQLRNPRVVGLLGRGPARSVLRRAVLSGRRPCSA